jgi:uncharacterized protein YukE
MTTPIRVTGDNVARMIAALEQGDADCDAASRAVNGTSDYLATVWTAAARNRYQDAPQHWLHGLSKVQQGLRELQQAMTSHYHSADVISDDASNLATWT